MRNEKPQSEQFPDKRAASKAHRATVESESEVPRRLRRFKNLRDETSAYVRAYN